MNIPETIKILGIPYTVKEVPFISRDSATLGQIDYWQQEIKLVSGLKPELKEQTLLHEVIHGILQALGLNFEDENEKIVQSMASALHQFVVDNKSLFT
jgi:hypothetical protein